MKFNKTLSILVLSSFISTGALAASEDIKITINDDRVIIPKSLDEKTENDNETLQETDEKYFYFDKEKGEITGYDNSAPKDVVIPSKIDGVSVKSIGFLAFLRKQLTSVSIPEGVTNIDVNALVIMN